MQFKQRVICMVVRFLGKLEYASLLECVEEQDAVSAANYRGYITVLSRRLHVVLSHRQR